MMDELSAQSQEQVRQYLNLFWYHRWWIFLSTLTLTLASAVVITSLPNQYEATTTILVDPQKIPETYVNSTVRQSLTDRLQVITQEVLSASGLTETIQQFELYPDLRKSKSRDELIEYMRKKIKIEVKNASGSGLGTFSLTYEGTSPEMIARVANALASRFIEWNLQSREQLAVGTTEFIAEQLEQARKSLGEQENRAREFKMSHMGEMPEQLAANLAAIAQLRVAFQANADTLNRFEQERIELKRTLELEARTGGDKPTSERGRVEAERRQLETQLAELRTRYTSVYPEVAHLTEILQRVNKRLQTLPPPSPDSKAEESSVAAVRLEIVGREMKRLGEEQKRIESQIASYQAKADAAPLREQQLADLTRDYQISKMRYSSLLEKKYSADMAADLERKQKAERFSVLDPATVPDKPVKPRRRLLTAFAALGSLFVSIGLVFLKEMLDVTIKAEKELKHILPPTVPVLVSIPTIETPADRRRRWWFAIVALTTSMIACLGVAALVWRIRSVL